MSIQSGSVGAMDLKRVQSAEMNKAQVLDLSKQASIAQATVKAVQDALAKTGVSSTAPAPSAQVSVDAGKIARLSSSEKSKDPDKLDTAKLDALKAKIQDGSFEFDYRAIASQLVEHAAQQRGSRRG
jgi:anti-sigma28 factor (negative regulator of flagellin synthesis)